MSAYIVDDITINRIVRKIFDDFFSDSRLFKDFLSNVFLESPEKLGTSMYKMNLEAVMLRYSDCADNLDMVPGPIDENGHHKPYKYSYTGCQSNKIQVFKSIDCYLYQCDEGNVSNNELYKFLSWYRSHLANLIVRSLVLYEKAEWG